MRIGNLQRRWQKDMPKVYDKDTRIVCLDIKKETQVTTECDDVYDVEGYSFIPVEIDRQIDYGHIKSQLIEAGYAQKDEFGLLMNSVDILIKAITENDTIKGIKASLDTEDIKKFGEFCEFRKMCADAAKEVMKAY